MSYVDSEDEFPLHWACRHDDKDRVDHLLKNNFNPNQTNSNGSTALHLACLNGNLYGNLECAKLLLKRGANVNAENKNKRTPLHWACEDGNFDVVKLLLDKGANVNAEDIDKTTPLHHACLYGHSTCANLLLKRGANANAEDIDQITPLHCACLNRCKKCCGRMFYNDINTTFENFNTMAILHSTRESKFFDSLHLKDKNEKNVKIDPSWAHSENRKNEIEVVRLLLSFGANVDVKDESNLTPLHIACMHGYFDAIKLLLLKNVNVNSVDNTESTALHYASMHGHIEIVEELLKHGADITVKNNCNSTPRDLAVKYGHGDKLTMLKGAPPDPVKSNKRQLKVNSPNPPTRTVSLQASQSNLSSSEVSSKKQETLESTTAIPNESQLSFDETLQYIQRIEELELRFALLESESFNKPHLNETKLSEIVENVVRKEPDLIYYIVHNDFKMVEKYIKSGANVNAKTLDKKTCLHICVENNSKNIFSFLIKQQSLNFNAIDKNKQTALHYAAIHDRFDMALILINHGINLDAKDSNGKTCLHICVESNLMDMFLLLVKQQRLNINATDRNEQTALHCAVEQDNLDMSLILIDKRIDVRIKNRRGQTAVQLANQLNLTNIVYLLNDYSLNEEVDDLESDSEQEHFPTRCRICLERRVDRVLISCGHTYCNFCIVTWRQLSSKCPTCRKKITQVIRLF